jgi:tetratricopeptide (TPR) repeat protein
LTRITCGPGRQLVVLLTRVRNDFPDMTLESRLGDALGANYRIERELGGGGMSRVFVAEEVELGRKVVVKVLPPDMAAGLNAERFRREIQLAASLQHPHIVPLIAAGRTGELVWYTMPLIEGESLRTRIARDGELPVSDSVRALRDVADALSYAHAHGVVHRDIKPDNVLISGRHAMVTDFGVAKALSASTGESSLTSIGVALGTPAYMAPEQASADPHVDHRADIYAFGAMAYEMLTGRPPFEGAPQTVLAAHVTQTPESVGSRRHSVPPAMAALVMRCLEKKPADRYQTAAELHQQLELMATPSGGAQPTTAVAAAPVSKRRMPPIWAVASVAVVAIAIAGVFVWRPWNRAGSDAALNQNLVAVLPFRVAGADPSMQYLRQGMLDLLQAKLTGEGGPRAADARSVLAAFREAGGTEQEDVPDNALLAIARKVGAGRILQGSIVGPPDHVVISAAVVAMPGARIVSQTSVEGPKDSLFTLVDRLTAQVLALGAGASAQQLSALTTPNLDALRAYLDGQAAYRRGSFEHSTQSLERAVQLDSTFALALSELIESHGWSPARTNMDRIRRLAWQYRARLNARDQLMLSIRLGSRYPKATRYTEQIAERERATQVVPESPQVWYELADGLFHYGAIAGIADHRERSQRAFERALALDSAYGGPISHLSSIAYLRGDTAGVRYWARRALALDSTGFGAMASRLELALILRDVKMFRELISAASASAPPTIVLYVYPLDSLVYAEQDWVFETARQRATTADDRLGERAARIQALFNRGRPSAAAALIDTMESNSSSAEANVMRMTAALFLDGDTTGLAASVPGTSGRASVVRELWNIAHHDLRSVNESINRLRTDPAQRDTVADTHLRMAALLEAWSAAERQAPDARARALVVDSMWIGWREGSQPTPLALARLLEKVGEPERALAAIRRRELPLGNPPFPGIVPAMLVEARLAARVGDRDGAVRAYRAYLLWRQDPEARLIPQRDSARAELAALTRRR